jgi:hypothetical protein
MNIKQIENELNKNPETSVEKNGFAIMYISNPTYEVQIKAVSQNGLSLQFIQKQTENLCLAAVKENGLALEFVDEQTEKIRQEAIKQNPNAKKFVYRYMYEKYTEPSSHEDISINLKDDDENSFSFRSAYNL